MTPWARVGHGCVPCQFGMSVRRETAVERLQNRISYRLDAERDKPARFRKNQQRLAEKLKVTKQTLSEMLHGPAAKQGLLARLDEIADYLEVPPSFLIHRNDSSLIEVSAEEAKLLKYWRTWTLDVRGQVLSMIEFLAGLLPEEIEDRMYMRNVKRLTTAHRTLHDESLQRLLRLQQKHGRKPAAQSDRPDQSQQPVETIQHTQTRLRTR